MKMKSRLVSVFALSLLTGLACAPSEPVGNGGKGGNTSTGKGGNTGTTTGSGGVGNTASGSGGNVGTTGAGGTIGTGGTGVVMKDCATKLTPMNPTLIDFETYDGAKDPTMF